MALEATSSSHLEFAYQYTCSDHGQVQDSICVVIGANVLNVTYCKNYMM
jgi:hypothetical protein